MSTITHEIIEKLKIITLLEASELVSSIEGTFGVDASVSTGGSMAPVEKKEPVEIEEEKTTFTIILEAVDSKKRIPILKVIRNLTDLSVVEAKEFISILPKTIQESLPKEQAEVIKQQLEAAGGTVKLS